MNKLVNSNNLPFLLLSIFLFFISFQYSYSQENEINSVNYNENWRLCSSESICIPVNNFKEIKFNFEEISIKNGNIYKSNLFMKNMLSFLLIFLLVIIIMLFILWETMTRNRKYQVHNSIIIKWNFKFI